MTGLTAGAASYMTGLTDLGPRCRGGAAFYMTGLKDEFQKISLKQILFLLKIIDMHQVYKNLVSISEYVC